VELTPLILASASPRRRDLLAAEGYSFICHPADVQEIAPAHLTAAETVLYNARLKATAVAQLHPNDLVLGVDTVVSFHGEVFGKPRDMDHAFEMLSRLNGQSHEVYSGVWLAHPSGARGFVEVSQVHFRQFSPEQLRLYLQRIQPLDKAGAYAAQDSHPDGIVKRIEGSRTNVIGLPMERLAEELRRFPSFGNSFT
jgi:septum formation protein